MVKLRNVSGLLFGIVMGCCSSHVGAPGLMPNSEQHKISLRVAELGAPEDSRIILESFSDRKERFWDGDGYSVEIEKLSSGDLVVEWLPQQERGRNVILTNGLGSDAYLMSDLARYLSQNGVGVFSVDRRGSGMNSIFCPSKEVSISDLEEIAGSVENLILVGQCFSTSLVIDAVKRNPSLYSSAIFLTPNFFMKTEISPSEKTEIFFDVLSGREHRNPIPPKLYLSDPSKIYLDPLFGVAPSAWTYVDFMPKSPKELENFPLPYVVVLASRDRIVDTPKTEGVSSNVRVLDAEHFLPLQEKYYKGLLDVITNEVP